MKNKKSTKSKPQKQKETKMIECSPEFESGKSIACHYGFIPLPPFTIEKNEITLAKKFDHSQEALVRPWTEESERFSGHLEEKIAIVKNIVDKKWNDLGMPISGYFEGPVKGNPHLKKSDELKTLNLEILGIPKPIAEAMILETTFVILKDRYKDEEFTVEINSIGDKDSITKFTRELQSYIKKESSKLDTKHKAELKKDVFNLFNFKDAKVEEFVERAPKPLMFLSDASRAHFSEVLEYLESLKIPYEINHKLLGSRSYASETVFEIRGKKEIFAIGERYNSLAKKLWGKKDVAGLGVAILLRPHFVTQKAKNKKEEKPKFYFIQIGTDAKRKSLGVIEEMRKAHIPVLQALSKDKLSLQMATAEKAEIPFIIMMGQKEAIEDSVVVRNMKTRVQETVSIKSLIPYLKTLK